MLIAPASALAGSVFLVEGGGWGHGVGMSQWGAYGYAKHGWTYDRILAHYYTGTTLGPAPVTTVRVLLATAKKVTIASTGKDAATSTDFVKSEITVYHDSAHPSAVVLPLVTR